jgi:RNA polymerase sigma-70 factor (ECF subfamily)
MSPARVVRLHRSGTTGPVTLGDEALVAACGVGDQAALGALYDRHHEAVARFVARLSSANASDVDDLVHDTFLSAYSASARFRGGSAVRTWLLGIASNVVRHAMRSRGRRQALATQFEQFGQDPAASPDEGVRSRELREAVARAIAALPHDQRAVFVLCDLEEMSGAEVAQVLGVPEGTVFRRRHDARRALREMLGSVR